ncbi:probable (S)-N-methylcoclaurine 3'-hydroxylase isozyme 2 [Solanum lycopersicum]|uniref:Cytochrome P450 n=1 Tax=Solanum lycopersicum TaxID=4081 RepID=A0A3Q7GTY3_SOLLC|nr:probable (S)-N-methylcoclaurine 3'-hydroxylase isozyme 2 [Solanum lycopersicum]
MMYYLITPILLSLVFVITLRYFYRSKTKLPLPPGPFSWPFIGNLFHVGRKRPHASLAKLAQSHAPDLMSLRFGTRLVVVASSPAAAAAVLKTHDRLLSGRFVSHPIRVEGSKLHNVSTAFLEECDENWKNVRTIYRGALFSNKALESQVSLRENKIREMMQYLDTKMGQVIKIKFVVFVTALNVLANLLLSVDLIDFEGKGIGAGLTEYLRKFTEAGGILELSDLYPVLGILCTDLQGTYKKLIGMFDTICAVWGDIVQDKRKRDSQPSLDSVDFVDALVKNGFTDKHVNALLLEIFAAGTESTTATSEWMLVELLRKPQALQKLRDEISQVVGGSKGIIKESDLPSLPYLDACFKETLRLHPPGPLLLPHRAVQTCEVMGYRIPRNTQVLVNMWAIARDSKIWDDPSSFKPERFINSKFDNKGQKFEYIPFGSGRRICAGEPLASRFIPLAVASLIHKFDWILPNEIDPAKINMDEVLDVTMFKKDSLLVIPKLRNV